MATTNLPKLKSFLNLIRTSYSLSSPRPSKCSPIHPPEIDLSIYLSPLSSPASLAYHLVSSSSFLPALPASLAPRLPPDYVLSLIFPSSSFPRVLFIDRPSLSLLLVCLPTCPSSYFPSYLSSCHSRETIAPRIPFSLDFPPLEYLEYIFVLNATAHCCRRHRHSCYARFDTSNTEDPPRVLDRLLSSVANRGRGME